MIRINNSNIYIGHIKQLLKDFNLPNCKVYKEGMVLSENCHYIYNNDLYICKEDNNSGELKLERIKNYEFNDKIENITKNWCKSYLRK